MVGRYVLLSPRPAERFFGGYPITDSVLTITAAIWAYGSRIAGDTGQIAAVMVDGGRC